MQRFLHRLFRVRPGEWKVVLLLQLQIFLIIAVLLVAKPAANAVFLSRFGAGALPYMYLLTALVAAIISVAYTGALRYVSILRVNLFSLGLCLLSLVVFALLVAVPRAQDILSIGLYLWVALFGVLAASQFWMMANLVFDIRQAKRLFGPIGAGAIAGGIVGGYLANVLAVYFGTRILLFVASGMLVPVLLISLYVWRRYIHPRQSALARKKQAVQLTDSPYGLIRRSRHLFLLSAIIVLSVVTAKLVDFQFSALAAERFTNPERLTAFFGFWFSTFNLIGLLIQLVLTQRVVQALGVSGALLFLPVGLSLGTFFMFLAPGLGSAIFSRLMDGSLKQSLHRAGVEMLFLPLRREVKQRIKTYIDVFIDSAAGGVGGLLLLLLVNGMGIPAPWISVPVLFLVMAWLICVLLVREEYLEAFRSQLKELRPKSMQPKLQSKHKEVLEGFLRVLQSKDNNPSEQQILFVLERAEQLRESQFLEPIRNLLHHASAEVRARAIRTLSNQAKAKDLSPLIEPLLEDEAITVKNAALAYFMAHYPETSVGLIRRQLLNPQAAVAGACLLNLSREAVRTGGIANAWPLEDEFTRRMQSLAKLPQQEAKEWCYYLLATAGYLRCQDADAMLGEFLYADNPRLRKTAIASAGIRLEEKWLLPLMGQLGEAAYYESTKQALQEYGLALVNVIPEYLKSGFIPIEDVRRLPAVLTKIVSEQTIDLLFALTGKYFPEDAVLRSEVFQALEGMHQEYPHLKFPGSMVNRYLTQSMQTYNWHLTAIQGRGTMGPTMTQLQQLDDSLNHIFQLIGLLYPTEDIVPIYLGVRSEDRSQQLHAIEFLDNLLMGAQKRTLIPLLEQHLQLQFKSTPGINAEEEA